MSPPQTVSSTSTPIRTASMSQCSAVRIRRKSIAASASQISTPMGQRGALEIEAVFQQVMAVLGFEVGFETQAAKAP